MGSDLQVRQAEESPTATKIFVSHQLGLRFNVLRFHVLGDRSFFVLMRIYKWREKHHMFTQMTWRLKMEER